jgi:uncharacterized protein YodC (DUF2158 family)
MTLKIGDIVELKSGGPPMTVTSVGADFGKPTVWWAWFDGTMQQQTYRSPAFATVSNVRDSRLNIGGSTSLAFASVRIKAYIRLCVLGMVRWEE